ncbi:MAG: hypothetical protein PHT83_01495 [Bacilli bacterium]|nr:hypothetical protein [Bacilli bacterium]
MKIKIEKIIICVFFISLGVLLMPIFHIVGLLEKLVILNFVVLICGFILGWPYGLACGLLIPPVIHIILPGLLTFYPNGLSLMIELGVCGLTSGVIYSFNVIKNNILNIYFALITTILIERVVGGLFKIVYYAISDLGIYGIKDLIKDFFVTPGFGIMLQIMFVPAVVLMYEKRKNLKIKKIT